MFRRWGLELIQKQAAFGKAHHRLNVISLAVSLVAFRGGHFILALASDGNKQPSFEHSFACFGILHFGPPAS